MNKESCLIGLLILAIIALLIFIYSLICNIHNYKAIKRKELCQISEFRATVTGHITMICICILVIIVCVISFQG